MKRRILSLFILLIAAVMGAWSQAYVTDVAVVGASSNGSARNSAKWYTDRGWHMLDYDLNRKAGGWYIYLVYKTSDNANPVNGYITDIIASTYNVSQFSEGGRQYYKVETNFNGDLNRGAGGADIFLYYTRSRANLSSYGGQKRVMSSLSISNHSNGNSVQWAGYSKYSGAVDCNKKAGGDDIFIQRNFTTQKLVVKNHPTMASDPIYNGGSQYLVSKAASGNYGTMYYRVNNGSWSTSRPMASQPGSYKVNYYLSGGSYANNSDTHERTVHILPPHGKATNLNGSFSQRDNKVTLRWRGGSNQGNFNNYQWAIYRNNQLVTKVNNNVTTYTENAPANEKEYTYSVRYLPLTTFTGRTVDYTNFDDAKAAVKVNTQRSIPVNALTGVSTDGKVSLTWNTVGYETSMNHRFNVYIDGEMVTTITPTNNQTAFKWEHRDNNDATSRTSTQKYSEEDLDACTPHTYRIVGAIGSKELNSAELKNMAINGGTTFLSIDASKGEFSGHVQLTWNVKRLSNQSADETYTVERRSLTPDYGDGSWETVTVFDSNKAHSTYEDKTALPGVYYQYRITCQNTCENGNRPSTTTYATGFALSTGVVSGRVTYGTGTAVKDVKVRLCIRGNGNEEVNSLRSLEFPGYGADLKREFTPDELQKHFANNFTVQCWVYPNGEQMKDNGNHHLFAIGSSAYAATLKYDNAKDSFAVCIYNREGGITNYQPSGLYIPANMWTHLSFVHDNEARTTTIYASSEPDEFTSAVVQGTRMSENGLKAPHRNFYIGHYNRIEALSAFRGFLDEFRVFNRTMTENEIRHNHNHLLVGTETGLIMYYPMDENTGFHTDVYDFSKTNNKLNKRHAASTELVQTSVVVPSEEQLSLMSYTDDQGNYVVRGVPFSGDGTNYTIVPTMGIHEFTPAFLSRFVSASSLVNSGVDFEDTSAFPVSGNVRYAGTDYPVEDCNIYVDGQLCAKNGEPVTTDAEGNFTVSVPIGDHFIQIKKNGHTFAAAGRYPADPNNLDVTHTFDQKITGLEFIDETLVNFTGRVVGGSIEGEKPVGFGLSANNIGQSELVLSPLNELYRLNVVKNVTETTSSLDTNQEEMAVASATEAINSTSVRGATADYCKKIFIRTDPLTGEFSAMVPPLEYNVESIKLVKSGLEVGQSTTIDLSNPTVEYQDSTRDEHDELLTYTSNTMLRTTYHTPPSFSVKQKGSADGHFGISSYTLTDVLGDVEVNDIYTKDEQTGEITYNYGGAMFVKDDKYTFELQGYEEYTNEDEEVPVTTTVPLSGIVVTINNALSSSQSVYLESGTNEKGVEVNAGEVVDLESNQMALDDEGYGTYTWSAGFPNIAEPYTRTISISYDIDGRTYQWTGNGMTGIILGELPTGNNFVTAGPDKLLMILRDPPGSGSSAEWSTGSSTSSSKVRGSTFTQNTQITTKFKFGFKNAVIVGTPVAGTITEAETKDELEIGAKLESEGESSTEQTTTTSITKAIATKDNEDFVGHQGDVFIGTSTNIIFGKARNLSFMRDGDGVKLAVDDIMTTGMKFATMFNYSLNYIEETLFPNLENLRNGFLTTVPDEATIKNFKNTGSSPVYLTTLTPDDEDYGQDGTYTFVKPAIMPNGFCTDSVMWVNNQLANWKSYLAKNEQEKVEAFANRTDQTDNYSFDSGSDVSYSIEKESTEASSWEWSVKAGLYVDNTTGLEVAGVGFDLHIEDETMGGTHQVDGSETSETSSFAFTLSEDGDDALTVDVYNYGNFSPIFRTRGGQTSNPYEGEVVTKYYQPGTVIMEATMQIEVPQIDVDEPVVSNIPSGSAANYTLRLSNASEIGADVAYRLFVLDETNEDGAQLTIDGQTITAEGRLFKVPGNQTLTKTLQLRQTDTGILNYDRIGLVFASDCQPEDIADTIYISAHFVPSSSTVDLALSSTTLNTQTGTDLRLTFNNFDRNYKNLKAFRIQYMKQGNSDWTLLHEYVLKESQLTNNNELLPDGADIKYTLPMANFTDGKYTFRVLSVATYGTGEVYRSSEEISLVKDMQRPRPLGQPEPADGILSTGDELSVTFNENILKGELTQAANFKVTGILNGAEVAHETALSMQGTETTAQTEASITLANKDFAIDAWVNLNGNEQGGTLLTHGVGTAKLTVGTDETGHFVVGIGQETFVSEATVPTGTWVFLTMSYHRTDNGEAVLNASVARDAETITLFNRQTAPLYEGNGPIVIGKSIKGAIHELLLWDVAHDMTDALLQRSRTKNPATRNLIGYWKMDEGEGTSVRDYSRNRHMTLANETWYMNNVNKAISIAEGSFISLYAGELPNYDEDDYALEFWMKAGKQQGDAQLVQMGEVGLWLNGNGELQLTGKGANLPLSEQTSMATTSGNLTDNAWHHVALSVLRQGAVSVYVDGVRRLTTNAANVGSIATNYMLLGTHRQLLSAQLGTYTYDRPFVGEIDEVRVWNATLNAGKLLSNREARLTGKEDGLVAYYPFETKQLDEYNQVVTVGTPVDLVTNRHEAQVTLNSADGSGASLSEEPSALTYIDDAPALRTKQTETNVPFTFVASDDKVVINIEEDAATIEGCTLNFTVRDVRDENGNYSSPAVWSAFVNRNQLYWENNSLVTEQIAATTGTLQATVVNTSGTMQAWTLSGMPAWLVPDVESGQTNPLSQTTVTFTVLPSAPIGRSEATVYLSGNDNIDTPLTINVKVTGDKPDWSVNPYDYEGSMNIVGQLYVEGQVSEDADDIVAAFIGEECRGVATMQYNARYDGYFVTMDIYGSTTEQGQPVTFRAYDASTGTLYPVVNANVPTEYAPLALLGTYAEPVEFSTTNYIEQQTTLRKGWNWMSLYVTTDNMTPQNIFSLIADDVLVVKSKSDGFVQATESNGLKGNLKSIENGRMYAVQMANERPLRLVGTRASGQVSLDEGWNWLGYGQRLASVGDAMAGMGAADGDIVKGQMGVTYFDRYEWMGSLLTMQPGLGYQVKSATAKTFSYPSAVTGVAASRMASVEENSSLFTHHSSLFVPADHHQYADNMIMTAAVTLDGKELTDVEIGVFAGEECRATAFTDSEGRAYITIPGDEACQLSFKVAVSNYEMDAVETLDYTVDAVCGSYSNPFVIDLNGANGIFELKATGVTHTVYDLLGRKLPTITGDQPSNLKKGVYIKHSTDGRLQGKNGKKIIVK